MSEYETEHEHTLALMPGMNAFSANVCLASLPLSSLLSGDSTTLTGLRPFISDLAASYLEVAYPSLPQLGDSDRREGTTDVGAEVEQLSQRQEHILSYDASLAGEGGQSRLCWQQRSDNKRQRVLQSFSQGSAGSMAGSHSSLVYSA